MDKVFSVPYFLFEDVGLNRSSRTLLISLLALQDKYILKSEKAIFRSWFNVSNKELMKIAKLSKNTLKASRHFLIEKGWIDFKQGFSGHNSEYCILLDNFVLCQEGQKEATTKN